ncbi:MAG: hypothetical protein COA58_04030 [Bacteroidetes bacterium]|nr:MAG: hypothetical protein COA58_04030 [Bacteroidota bacterium]
MTKVLTSLYKEDEFSQEENDDFGKITINASTECNSFKYEILNKGLTGKVLKFIETLLDDKITEVEAELI